MKIPSKILLLLGLGCAALGSGCVNVKPWERSVLADYTMRPDRNPLADAFAEHTWFCVRLRPAAAEWVEEVAAAIKQPRRTKRRILSTMSNLQPKPSSCSNRP